MFCVGQSKLLFMVGWYCNIIVLVFTVLCLLLLLLLFFFLLLENKTSFYRFFTVLILASITRYSNKGNVYYVHVLPGCQMAFVYVTWRHMYSIVGYSPTWQLSVSMRFAHFKLVHAIIMSLFSVLEYSRCYCSWRTAAFESLCKECRQVQLKFLLFTSQCTFEHCALCFSKTVAIEATFKFRYIHERNNCLTIFRRLLRHFQDHHYQNRLADILCNAIQLQ